ncbi:unnamed protein product [Ceutorhynchus assimilis]|uniref:Major facilitator superfamily (MFS) profile domain-containing protein n=1 Tax=Ceutorhynchus assimilis TaxID=467358 RepID=A0A9N9QL51_9CUCU|nr:unnamed protein product [Ceutorhynchus assimilis]
MAFGLIQIPHDKNDGKQLTQYLAVISASFAVFTVGIYQGWSSPSLIKIFSDEYPIDVTDEEASYITIIGNIGHVFAGFLASYLSDRIGRKSTMLAIAIPQILSFGLIYMSFYSKTLLYISRVLGGMGEGAVIAILPCYIGEIADSNVRGTLGAFIGVVLTLGIIFINVIGSLLTIHEVALVCHIFPIIFWLTFIGMPESPYYCLMKEDKDGAKLSIQMLRRKQSVDKEILQLSSDVNRQMSETGTFKDLFAIQSNCKAFLLVAAARFFQAFSGIGAIRSYNQMIIAQTTNFSPLIGSTIILSANLIMMLISSWYIDKIGRKPMFVISAFLTFLIHFSQGIFLTIQDYTSVDLSQCSWVPLLTIIACNLTFAGGLGPGVNVFIGEIFSTSIKAKAMSACSFVFALSYMSSIKVYQYTNDNVGTAVPFYIFGTTTLIGAGFFAFVLPETRGKPLEVIQQELKGNVVEWKV